MSSLVNGVRLPFGRRIVAFGSIGGLLRIEGGQERFHLVVAERPEDLGGDRHGRGRAFRELRRIESRNQVSPLASIAVKPGCAPAVFSRISTHFDGSGGCADIRAARELLGRHRPACRCGW